MIGLAVDALAVYRLTRLATRDTITEPLRDAIEARSVEVVTEGRWTHDTNQWESGLLDVQPWAFARDLLDCHWCTSVWVAGLLWLVPRRVRRALALAALAGFIAEHAER